MINFDDQSAPDVFNNTTPLRENYAALGVHFSGAGQSAGGGIVTQKGGWSTSGSSSPNFLAFNTTGRFQNGVVPQGPEIVSFDMPVSYVEIKAGSPYSGTVTMRAFDALGTELGSTSQALTSPLQKMSLQAPNIRRVNIESDAFYFAVDDLGWNIPASVAGTNASKANYQ